VKHESKVGLGHIEGKSMNEREFYSMAEHRDDWAFSHVPRTQTREITHSYHKYPAKFIPQLARALIRKYTKEKDLIWDPFCGSGTLNLEAFRTYRHSIGTDINPIAVLISRVKTTPLEPDALSTYRQELLEAIDADKIRSESFYLSKKVLNGNVNVLRKWFSKTSLLELGHILWQIRKQPSERIYREFALCSFSSVLKRSSYWLNSSVKAQIDPDKKPRSPLFYFKKQLGSMQKANDQFWNEAKYNQTHVRIFRHNASHTLPLKVRELDCIITSPPYVVSYDYSDIFKLSTYFLFYQEDYKRFRRTFVGTPLRKNGRRHFNISVPDQLIVDSVVDTGIRRNLTQYYKDMSVFFKNANDHLKNNGRLILVVGDTQLRGIRIPNAYLLNKIAAGIGWSLERVYERQIPVKILPTFRDEATGKFTNRQNSNCSERYEKEYILVLRR
jgi:tRNA G10  N-methylase Trm11